MKLCCEVAKKLILFKLQLKFRIDLAHKISKYNETYDSKNKKKLLRYIKKKLRKKNTKNIGLYRIFSYNFIIAPAPLRVLFVYYFSLEYYVNFKITIVK